MEETEEYYFTASMDSGRAVHNLLKAVQISEHGIFCATDAGLKLTVEEGKCVQASAYIPADNFSEFSVRDNVDVIFKVNLAVLTECLNIFGATEESSLKMYYKSEGSPLILVLQPSTVNNVVTDCKIPTLSVDSLLQLRDEDAPEAVKLVLKAPLFHGILADIERSCDFIELHFSQLHPNLSIVTYGMQHRSCFDLTKSSDIMLSFTCSQDITIKYQFSHIRLILKALAICTKAVMICNAAGVLLVQLKMEKEDQKQMFAEFYILPQVDD